MTCLNLTFDLTVEDMDLIETALRQSHDRLSDRCLSYEHSAWVEGGQNRDKARRTGETVTRIQALLGRLREREMAGGPAQVSA